MSTLISRNTFDIIWDGDIGIFPFEGVKGVVVGGLDEFDVVADFILWVIVEGDLSVGDIFVSGHLLFIYIVC